MKAVSERVWKSAQTGHLQTWQGVRNGLQPREQRLAHWAAILARTAERRPFRAGERVLDIGCGLDTLADLVDGVRGFTLDSLMAKIAPLGLAPGARHSAGLFEALPFRDGSFDRVFLLNVLDHVRSPEAGLRELARVLRPGGQLVLSVDTYAGRRFLGKRLHKWWARTRGARTKHPWVFSTRGVVRLLARVGLEAGAPEHVAGDKERRSFFTAEKTKAPI